METIEQIANWQSEFDRWKQRGGKVADDKVGDSYPFVKNSRAPFTPAHRALPMMNLALISSAGGYIDGADPFDVTAAAGDLTFREIPSSIDLEDLRFSARGYDPTFVERDVNVQIPLARLSEFEANRIIGQVNSTFWSFCGFIPEAGRLVSEMLPRLIERLQRYEVQAALLIPASQLCHQSVALAARAIEQAGIPTMMLSVDRTLTENVRPPRAGFYKGTLGSVAGEVNWPEHQRRVLDEALRWIEAMDQPGTNKLVVELESQVEAGRGER